MQGLLEENRSSAEWWEDLLRHTKTKMQKTEGGVFKCCGFQTGSGEIVWGLIISIGQHLLHCMYVGLVKRHTLKCGFHRHSHNWFSFIKLWGLYF